jgi:hypothetical protein
MHRPVLQGFGIATPLHSAWVILVIMEIKTIFLLVKVYVRRLKYVDG